MIETKLVKNVIFTVPTIPAVILSDATINDNRVRFFSLIAAKEKNKLVNITKKAPIIKDL